jgi:hypothetical protein
VSDQYILYAPAELDEDEFVDRQMQIMPVRVRGAGSAEAEASILAENKAAISSFASRTQQQHDLTGGHRAFFQQRDDLRFTYTNSGNQPIIYVDANAAPLTLPTPRPVESVIADEPEAVAPPSPVEADVVTPAAEPTTEELIFDISPEELQLPADTYLGAIFLSADQTGLDVPGSVTLRNGQTFELPVDRSLAIVFSLPLDPDDPSIVPDVVQEQIGYLRFPADIIWASDPAARPALYAAATGYLNRSEFVPYPSPLPIYEIAVEIMMPYRYDVTVEAAYDTTDLSNVEFLLGPNAVQGVDYDDRGFDFRGYVIIVSESENFVTYGTVFDVDYFVLGESSTGRQQYDVQSSLYFATVFAVSGKTLLDSYGYVARDPRYVTSKIIVETSVGAEKIEQAGSTFTASRDNLGAGYFAAQQQITDILTLGPDFAVGWSLDVQERDSRTSATNTSFRPAEYVDLYADAVPFAQKPGSETYDRRLSVSVPFDPAAPPVKGSRYIPDDAAVFYTDSIFYAENYEVSQGMPFADVRSSIAVPLRLSAFSFASQADSGASGYPGSSDTPIQALSVDFPNGGLYENRLAYNPDKDIASG